MRRQVVEGEPLVGAERGEPEEDRGAEVGEGELDVAPGETVRLPAELGIGQLIVSVPSGVCVTGHAEAKGGDLLVRGESNSGASPEFDRGGPAPGSKLPQVEIDAELHLEVVRRLKILRTPTTLVLDAGGAEVARAAGAPTKDQVLTQVAALP